MTRRRLLLFGLLATIAILATVWLLWPRTAITRENAAKIQPGITLADVEKLLGCPDRDESTGPLTGEDGRGGWRRTVSRGGGVARRRRGAAARGVATASVGEPNIAVCRLLVAVRHLFSWRRETDQRRPRSSCHDPFKTNE
jgi:hypothetical protein